MPKLYFRQRSPETEFKRALYGVVCGNRVSLWRAVNMKKARYNLKRRRAKFAVAVTSHVT